MAALLSELNAGLRGPQGVSVLVGDRGTGTSLAASIFVRRVASATQAAIVVRPTSSATAIARDALTRLDPDRASGVDDESWVPALRGLLAARAAAGKSTVVMIDEAERLSPRALEDLAELFDDDEPVRLHLFLVGRPLLLERLNAGAERALLAHVLQICRLEPLGLRETVRYLERRLAMCGGEMLAMFDEEAVDEVVRRSGGRLAWIEELADGAASRAMARGQKRATAADVASVALDDREEEEEVMAPKQEALRFEMHDDEVDDDSWSAEDDDDGEGEWSDGEDAADDSDEWGDDDESDEEWAASDDEDDEGDLRWDASSKDFEVDDDELAQEPRAARGAAARAIPGKNPPPRVAGRAVLSAVACLGLVWAANQLPGPPEAETHGRDVKLFAEPLTTDPEKILRLAGSAEAADADAHVEAWNARPVPAVASSAAPAPAPVAVARAEKPGEPSGTAEIGPAQPPSSPAQVAKAPAKALQAKDAKPATVASAKAPSGASVANRPTARTASTASKASASTKTPSVASSKKPSSKSVYTVQLGAFKARRNAEEMVTKLRGKSPRILQEGGFYRVVSGSFASKRDASLHEASLRRAGYTTYVRSAVF